MSNNNLSSLYKSFTIARTRTFDAFSTLPKSNSSFLENFKSIRNHKMVLPVVIAVALIAVFFIGKSLGSANSSVNQINAPAPVATQTLNRNFKFPLRDTKGKTVSEISYYIQSANLQDSFIYQGKLATAVKNREFLIFNLKITNPYSKTIQINAKDYIRVKMNGTSELLAPEIHNDPVEIQANSTKYTRVGLPINNSDKNLIVLIGELQGKKETINLSLSR